MRRRIPICTSIHALSSIQQGLRQRILGLSSRHWLFRPSSLVQRWMDSYLSNRPQTRAWTRFPRSDLLSFCCFRWVLSTVRVFGRVRLGMCLTFSFERKELKGSRNYHLVKPLSPSKLVHPYDGSVIPSIRSPVREYFIMTARFRLLPPRPGGFLVSHPASWIEVQSLPRGCSFLTPTRQGRDCTFHQ